MELNDEQNNLLEIIKGIMPELERYKTERFKEVTEEILQLDNKCKEILPSINELYKQLKENRGQGNYKTYNLVKDFLGNYEIFKDNIRAIKDFEERKEKIRELFKKDKTPNGMVIYVTHPKVHKISDDFDTVYYKKGETIYTTSTFLELSTLCCHDKPREGLNTSFFSNLVNLQGVSYNDIEYPKNCVVPITGHAFSRIHMQQERDMSGREKRGCKTVENRIKHMCESKDPKYDKPGKVSFYVEGPGGGEIITIDSISQRDLAKVGILPDQLDWEKIETPTITQKDIADADREQALTTTEVSGCKRFMMKLLDKFKGRGER